MSYRLLSQEEWPGNMKKSYTDLSSQILAASYADYHESYQDLPESSSLLLVLLAVASNPVRAAPARCNLLFVHRITNKIRCLHRPCSSLLFKSKKEDLAVQINRPEADLLYAGRSAGAGLYFQPAVDYGCVQTGG